MAGSDRLALCRPLRGALHRLLSRRSKRNAALLPGGDVADPARYLDLFFMIGPRRYPAGLGFHWLDLAARSGSAASGGPLRVESESRPWLPLRDAGLESALHAEHH